MQGGGQRPGAQRRVQRPVELAVANQEHGRKVENFVALDQPAIAPGIHPAQAIHRESERGKLHPRPAAGGTSFPGEDQQGNAGQGKQMAICV
ncbi:hypothetical protein D3C81_1062950 [compost metagenome]